MSNNNYNSNYYQNNFHKRNKNYEYSSKKYQNSNIKNYREVEINSMEQTEPTKKPDDSFSHVSPQQTQSIKFNDELSVTPIDQIDIISKTNDANSITNFKQEFLGVNTEDIIYKEYSGSLKNILNKLEEFDLDKKFSEFTDKMQEVKNSLTEKIELYSKKNKEDITEIKELFDYNLLEDLNKKLLIQKGEPYSKKWVIKNVYEFEKYFDYIISDDLKNNLLFNNKKNFYEILEEIYQNKIKEKNIINIENSEFLTLNDKFWNIIEIINNKKSENIFEEKQISLNLSGNIFNIIKHFRGITDDIIIEIGDIITYIDSNEKIEESKNKIMIIIYLIFEILSKQIEYNGLNYKIFAYGNIYYGEKKKEIKIKEFEENNIFFDFIKL